MKKTFSAPLRWTLFTLVCAVLAFAVWRQLSPAAEKQSYRLENASRGDLSQSVAANGTLNPVTLVNVGTQVSGTVNRLYVDFNSRVEQGQVLLELDDAMLAAQLKQSLANVQGALASQELAAANAARMRALYAQEYVSRQELDTAVQAEKTAAVQVQVARAVVEKDRANLGYAVVRSPVAGVVVDRAVDVGQTVAASLQAPTLFKIAQDLARMQIDASFAEADIGNIRVGQIARFNVDAFPNRSFSGQVRQVRLNPTNTQNVVTYDVVIDVENPELILLPGMTAYVSITVAERKDVLRVPNAALRFHPDKAKQNGKGGTTGGQSGIVYVLQNGQPQPLKVTLGISDNRQTEITGGELKDGQAVILGTQERAAADSARAPRMRLF